MDFLMRAYKQNIRKPMKTFMIFLVMVVIANLIVTGIFILKGTEKATNATLSKMSPIVYYTQDWDRYWRAMELGFISEDEQLPPITAETALNIAKMDGVKAFDLGIQTSVLIPEIKKYKDPNNQDNNGGIMFRNDGDISTEENDEFNPEEPMNVYDLMFDVVGTSSTEFKVASETIELVSGAGISMEEVDQVKQVILVEERLAKANDLTVGDTVSVQFRIAWDGSQYSGEEAVSVDFEIIGIFKNLTAQDQNDAWTNERAANQVYMPYNVAVEYMLESSRLDYQMYVANGEMTQDEVDTNLEQMESGMVNTVGFLLNDPLKVRDFIADAKNLLPSEYHMLKVGNSTYDSIAKSIDSMTQTSNLIIYIVFGAGVLILSLITSLTLKSREYEIGVLLSLGESKLKVIGQLMSELLMISIVAFSLSIFTGNFLAKTYGEKMLQTQMENTMNESNNGMIWVPDSMGNSESGNLQYTDFVSNFELDLEPMVYVELMTYGILVVAISTFIPIIFIMRYNPKTILSIR